MPLLMCPNCQAGMQSLTRSGVEFDMCPTCRGVWLDRGELEKLMEGARTEGAAAPPAPQAQMQPQPGYAAPSPQYRKYDDDDDDDRHRYGQDPRYRKKRGFDIFDIFD